MITHRPARSSSVALLLVGLAVAVNAAGVDRVPQDFPTIQAAIAGGTARVIQVGPGRWAGATVTRQVEIRGHAAVIDQGVPVGPTGVGFALPPAASGSKIVGFEFDCTSPTLDIGVLSSANRTGGNADDIAIVGSTFLECTQGITNSGPESNCQPPGVLGGARWLIEHDRFVGLRSEFDAGFTGGGLGVFIFNAPDNSILHSRFEGTVQDTPDFSTAGVFLAGCWNCFVNQNRFEMEGGTDFYSGIANFGNFQPGAAATMDLVVANNDARKDSAPYFGVNYQSYDSFLTVWQGNFGTTLIDHSFCGDGESDMYETSNRSEKVIPPNEALSRPFANPQH